MLIKATSATATILIERRIRLSEVRKVIEFAEGSKDQFLNRLTGYFLTSLSLGRVRYWVEYSKKADFFLVHSAYAHGMKILEGISKHFKVNNALTDWACGKCDKLLEWVTVKLQYLDQTFETDIPACPFCQGVLISEELAVGKMTMVEMLLEDK